MSDILYFPILFLLLFIAAEIYLAIARRYNIVDSPDNRSSSRLVTATGGGIIFPIAVILCMIFNPALCTQYAWFLVALLIIAVISFIDDIRSLNPLPRLIVHFLAVLLLGMQFDIFTQYPWWVIFPFLIAGVGIINAYNFMDGINGMTALYSLLLLVILTYINQYILPQPFVSETLIHSVTFGVIVFSFYNVRTKARCFAGDVGSISMAFIILFLLAKLIISTGNIAYITLLAVYGVDSVLTILHRIILRENITMPHRKHLYQILSNELHWHHTSVSMLYVILQAIIMILFFTIPQAWQCAYMIIVILMLCVAYILFMRKYYNRFFSGK